ncbi:hypothetical protein CWI36_0019p0010 [Hamiltosporidium magnivora]|uniref:Uncharacterized protein n=1 Tax=Hamiltosporidium magnivora TaxID=148818 RepID=A0A4Q9LMG1_9MICR|nr:hypothetical protein CWI36_0019p0010 [Hamiltosporidium magnivora]
MGDIDIINETGEIISVKVVGVFFGDVGGQDYQLSSWLVLFFDVSRNIFKLIDMMIGLQEIYFVKANTKKLNRMVDQIFYITELRLWNINRMIDFVKLSENNKKLNFKATNKDISDSEYVIDSINLKDLQVYNFSNDNLDVEAFSNLLNLKEIHIHRINFQHFKYKIKRIEFEKINISEKDLIFIANLKKIEDILFISCDIQGKAYRGIKFLFFNEGSLD